ncbi:MAG: hypothetical protein H0X17_11980 [Deltaproteobacteria bacterium]|nr:hypothetical protein [Deltaproteobacteria bacterium]
MKVRLRLPHVLVYAVSSGAIAATGALTAASAVSACGEEPACVPCLPDPRIVDAGPGAPDAPPCPACLPEDGVCPVGCIPEGFA